MSEAEVRRTEKLVVSLNLIFGAALVVFALTGASGDVEVSNFSEIRENSEDITFVAVQGGSTTLYPHAGYLSAIHNPTKETVWRHEQFRRYMDVDPLNRSTVLFLAEKVDDGDVKRIASVYNWRKGKELERFQVPHDTHDVDRIEGKEYVVADKANARIYVYNATSGEISWEYDFFRHFRDEDGGPGTHEYTHMNDVEVAFNGSAFLASPRNFDRVFLINKSSKEVIWELGEEDNYSILYEQHNPDILSTDPPTLIVSDSENDRVVEYSKRNGEWSLRWKYKGSLNWPRDGDRLPNGNTLIVDSAGNRVIEVTPEGKVVWKHKTGKGPYDAERLGTGDESVMKPFYGSVENIGKTQHPVTRTFDNAYKLVGVWVMPERTGKTEFGLLMILTLIDLSYVFYRIADRIQSEGKS